MIQAQNEKFKMCVSCTTTFAACIGDFEYCKYPNFIIINQNTALGRIYVLAADLTM